MDRFALLAIDQNKNIDQQFLSYLKKQDTQDTRSFSLSNAQTKATGVYPLADIEVLYQQINEFSTYTVPTKLILEGVNVTHTNFHIGRAENIVDYTVQTRNHYLGNDHAYILLDGGNYYIVDNNTQNHTYLNERRLEPSKPTLFHAGDTIRMADVVFNVIMGS